MILLKIKKKLKMKTKIQRTFKENHSTPIEKTTEYTSFNNK